MNGTLTLKMFQKSLNFPFIRSEFYKNGDIVNLIQVDIYQAT